MARSPEKMAAGMGFDAFSKATDLQQRLLFTLGALIVYRLGSYIPVPGIDPTALAEIFSRNSSGILGMFDMFSGGSLGRMTIFALTIMPYITSSIIMQLMTAIVPSLEALKKDGAVGEDEVERAEKELEAITKAHVDKIDEALKNKEAELLEV